MARAIHLKCGYENGRPRNLSSVGKGVCRSGFWDMGEEEARSLEGGWIYLHETKSQKSYLGGMISKVEPEVLLGKAHPNRIVFIFSIRPECRDQVWRGADHRMAHNGGLVEATFPHELKEARHAPRP